MIRLFVNTYTDPDAARNAELRDAAARNMINPSINEVVEVRPGERATFADMFEAVRARTAPGDISIVANADICFDETLICVNEIAADECFALSRWDEVGKDLRHFGRCDSQDAWCFRGAVRPTANCEFIMGMRGCDNRIARILHDSGYRVSNPSKSIRPIHLHASDVRRYPPYAVPGQYMVLPPCELPPTDAVSFERTFMVNGLEAREETTL